MSNPYGPHQPSQWGGPQAPNGQYPVGAQGGAVYGTPSAQQQPSGATGAGYGHAQPTVNQQAQPGYYQAPSPMPQVQPVGAPSYGSVGAMPPRQKSHAGLIIGIVVAFVLDIMWGSVSLPASDVIDTLLGRGENTTTSYVVLNFRLPKALTSLIAGAGISIAGLQMQTLFPQPPCRYPRSSGSIAVQAWA